MYFSTFESHIFSEIFHGLPSTTPTFSGCYGEWVGPGTVGTQVTGVLREAQPRQVGWLLSVGYCWQVLAQTHAQKYLLDLVELREEKSQPSLCNHLRRWFSFLAPFTLIC